MEKKLTFRNYFGYGIADLGNNIAPPWDHFVLFGRAGREFRRKNFCPLHYAFRRVKKRRIVLTATVKE